MKRLSILLALLALSIAMLLTACDNNVPNPDETQAESPVADTTVATETPTSPALEETTAPVSEVTEPEETTAPASEDPEVTVPEETEPAKKYRDEWDEDDPENPFNNLIPVGVGYDGKTTCYDGRYDFGYSVCKTSDGEYFSSIQEAVWHLEDIGGGIVAMQEATNICLYLEIPDDGYTYRLTYEFLNVDFVFNYGAIYDDCTPRDDIINGYAYYNYVDILDGISSALGGTRLWVLSDYEDLLTPGYYDMVDEAVEDPDWFLYYNYKYAGEMTDWVCLPLGEILPE